MTFYISWCKENEEFDPQQHCREDLKVLGLRILEKEGYPPKAWVTIPNPWFLSQKPRLAPYGVVSYVSSQGSAPVLLFRGRVQRFPLKIEGAIIQLELTAQRGDEAECLQDLKESLLIAPYWDPLFVSHEKRQDPQWVDVLDAYSKVLYWDRCTGVPALCDYFQGQHTRDLGSVHFADTLSLKITETPLSSIQVHLHAHWKQRYQGTVTLDPVLGAQFPEALLSTLTPRFCEENWWKPGMRLKDAGYEVISSSLEEVAPGTTGVLNLYPPCSKPLMVGEGNDTRKMRLKRAWYRMHLKLGWSYRQRRYEQVTFQLHQETQNMGGVGGAPKVLNLYVHDIQDDVTLGPWLAGKMHTRGDHVLVQDTLYQCLKTHRASAVFSQDALYWKDLGPYAHLPQAQSLGTFFTTERGHQAIQHAIEVAKCYLGASSRALTLTFECSLEVAQTLSCQHSVCLRDPRLPGGKAMGKVTQLVLDVCGRRGVAKGHVTLSCALGTGRSLEKVTPQEGQDLCYTPSGLVFESVGHQVPLGGIPFPQKLGPSDIAREILVHNDAVLQQDQLRQMTFGSLAQLKEGLSKMPTRLKIVLEDLRAFPRLDHHIQLRLLNRWSAPAHIHLEGTTHDPIS